MQKIFNDIEKNILGCCIDHLQPDNILRVKDILNADMFENPIHTQLYSLVLDMFNKAIPIDILTVSVECHKRNLIEGYEYEEINPAYISRLIDGIHEVSNLEFYATIIRQEYLRRKLVEIKTGGTDGNLDPVQEAFETKAILDKILELKVDDDWIDFTSLMIKSHDYIHENKNKGFIGIRTGFSNLDKNIQGFQKSKFYILGARPSMGKTALATSFALQAGYAGKKTGIISLESPDVAIGSRILSLISKIEFSKVNSGDMNPQEYIEINEAMTKSDSIPIYLSDQADVNITDIRAKAKKLHRREGLDFLIIDYIQLIGGDGTKNDNRDREIGKISRGLKMMAMEMNIPILALCQLSRKSEDRTDKKPRLADLRESGNLEQDADLVMMLHRDFKYGLNLENGSEHEADLIIEKNKEGECCLIKLGFDGKTMRFYDQQFELIDNYGKF